MVEQAAGGRWCDDSVAVSNIADSAQQFRGAGILEQEPRGAGLESGVHILVEVKGGQNQHLGIQWGRRDASSGLDTVHLRHPDVHEGDVDRHST